MRRFLISVFTLALLVPSVEVFADSANRDLGAVRLSTQELGSILEAVESQLDSGSSGTLELGNGKRAIERSGDYSLGALEDAPNPSTNVYYRYHAAEGPITLVIIKLDRYESRVSIEGESGPRVESLADYIQNRYREYRTFFGGGWKAVPAYSLLCMVALLIVIRYFGRPSNEVWISLALLMLVGAFLTGLIANRLLPMVRVYQGKPLSDLWTSVLAGLIVAAFLFLLRECILFLRRRSSGDSPADA